MLITLCLLSRELNNFHFQHNLPSQCIIQYLNQYSSIDLLLTSILQSRHILQCKQQFTVNVLPWQRVGARKKWGEGVSVFQLLSRWWLQSMYLLVFFKKMPAVALQARFTQDQGHGWVLLDPPAYLDIIISISLCWPNSALLLKLQSHFHVTINVS